MNQTLEGYTSRLWKNIFRPKYIDLVQSVQNYLVYRYLASFAAVIRVVTQRSSPLTAAHWSSAFLPLKLTNKEQASISWKPGPSPSRNLKTNLVDLSSAFSDMCKKFEFSDLNKTQKEVLTQVVLKKKDIFVSFYLLASVNLSFFKLYL